MSSFYGDHYKIWDTIEKIDGNSSTIIIENDIKPKTDKTGVLKYYIDNTTKLEGLSIYKDNATRLEIGLPLISGTTDRISNGALWLKEGLKFSSHDTIDPINNIHFSISTDTYVSYEEGKDKVAENIISDEHRVLFQFKDGANTHNTLRYVMDLKKAYENDKGVMQYPSTLYPWSNGLISLGKSAARFSDLYIKNIDANNNAKIKNLEITGNLTLPSGNPLSLLSKNSNNITLAEGIGLIIGDISLIPSEIQFKNKYKIDSSGIKINNNIQPIEIREQKMFLNTSVIGFSNLTNLKSDEVQNSQSTGYAYFNGGVIKCIDAPQLTHAAYYGAEDPTTAEFSIEGVSEFTPGMIYFQCQTVSV